MEGQNLRYKIREERTGAMLFDMQTGIASEIDEEEYQQMKSGKSEAHRYLWDESGTRRFTIYKSTRAREDLPHDCLSAPSKAYIELTRGCNLRCKHCYNKSGEGAKQELTKQEAIKLIDELEEMGTFEIRFTGGEATTHPDFQEIAMHARRAGLNISLGTNGIWDDKTLEKIKECRFNTIIVSIDGPKDKNDPVRGAGTYDNAVKSIKEVKSWNGPIIKINCVLSKDNKGAVEHIIRLADEIGAEAVNFATLKLNGRATGSENIAITPKDMMEIVKEISKLRKSCRTKIHTYMDVIDPPTKPKFQGSLINKRSCAAGIEAAAIMANGSISGCVVSPANDDRLEGSSIFKAGHIKEGSFKAIWLDSKRWGTFRDIERNKSSKCKTCNFYKKTCFGNCPVSSYLSGGELSADDPECFAEIVGGCGDDRGGDERTSERMNA